MKRKMLKLRIHHVFDIIRDFGSNKKFEKHIYGHSYHIVANNIYEKKINKFKIVVSSDDICKNCIKLVNNKCIDSILHRKDFNKKEAFNNYLDNRIMEVLNLREYETMSLEELSKISNKYIDNIEYIYKGNDENHTQERKKNVVKGIKKIKKELHNNQLE